MHAWIYLPHVIAEGTGDAGPYYSRVRGATNEPACRLRRFPRAPCRTTRFASFVTCRARQRGYLSELLPLPGRCRSPQGRRPPRRAPLTSITMRPLPSIYRSRGRAAPIKSEGKRTKRAGWCASPSSGTRRHKRASTQPRTVACAGNTRSRDLSSEALRVPHGIGTTGHEAEHSSARLFLKCRKWLHGAFESGGSFLI